MANSARGISDADAGFANPGNGFTNRHGRIAKKPRGARKLLGIIGWIDINKGEQEQMTR